jgi:hypothetical protein
MHRVGKLCHGLVDVVACRTLERADVKACGVSEAACLHGGRLALRTQWWLVRHGHHASPRFGLERYRLSVTGRCRWRVGDAANLEPTATWSCTLLLRFRRLDDVVINLDAGAIQFKAKGSDLRSNERDRILP